MNSSFHSHRVAIVAFSKISVDARVLRQVEFLGQKYEVFVVGYGLPPTAIKFNMYSLDEQAIEIPLSEARSHKSQVFKERIIRYSQLTLGRVFQAPMYEAWYWNLKDIQQAYDRLIQIKPQIIHANDWISLPLAVCAAKQINAKVIVDLHEYAPLEKDGLKWRLFLKPQREYVLKRYMKYANASITVNETIANKYKIEFGFDPIVVMNAPTLDLSIQANSTNPESIQLIHHGGFGSDRKPELMLTTIAMCDRRYHLNLMLIGDTKQIKRLEKTASQVAPNRVTFYQPVAPHEVVKRISRFDIGFYLLPATNYNNWVASPNKFFDFLHAGLAICVGPSPEMKRLCENYGCGVSASSFDPADCAKILNGLSVNKIDKMKSASLLARQEINAEKEFSKLLDLYSLITMEIN